MKKNVGIALAAIGFTEVMVMAMCADSETLNIARWFIWLAAGCAVTAVGNYLFEKGEEEERRRWHRRYMR